MGHPQSNQQTPFIGYPQNQLYNPSDLQYMQDTQQQFLDWGQWQPGMTSVSQWDQSNGALDAQPVRQQMLNQYLTRIGTPYEQSQRQAYWQQMGGQHYGGIIAPEDPLSPFPGTPAYNKKMFEQPGGPWGALNSMGISSAYGMPAWQQDQFASQNAGPGQPNNFEQFSSMPGSGLSDYGIPTSFTPGGPSTMPSGGPAQPAPPPATNNPAAPEWMYPQQQSAWGNDSSNPWSSNTGWGGKGWGQ